MSLELFARALSRFVPLTNEQLARVEALPFHIRNVGRHSDVVSRGEMQAHLLVNLSGWAAGYALQKNGRRRITSLLFPEDFCGLHALCHAEMDYSIVALTDCKFALVELAAFENLARLDADINRALLRGSLVAEATLRVWLLNYQDAYRILAHLICEIDARVGHEGSEGGRIVPLPITQEALGDALGLTSVHVNRTMRALTADGLVRQERGSLLIPDVQALRRAATFNPSYLNPPVGVLAALQPIALA